MTVDPGSIVGRDEYRSLFATRDLSGHTYKCVEAPYWFTCEGEFTIIGCHGAESVLIIVLMSACTTIHGPWSSFLMLRSFLSEEAAGYQAGLS